MLNERTDLALEMHEIKSERNINDGIIVDEEYDDRIKTTRIVISSEKASSDSNLKIGKYITIEVEEIWNEDSVYLKRCVNKIKRELTKLIPSNCKNCLVVGLGNRRILCDSIGPKTVDHILVTRHIKDINDEMFEKLNFFNVASFSPGVLSDTGIESSLMIGSIIKEISPDFVIVIDALASRNINRLAKTIQITDTGISPGSGVNNNRQALNSDLLGIPIISIGIPTVVDAQTMIYNIFGHNYGCEKDIDMIEQYFQHNKNYFVSLKETDVIIEKMTKVLSLSINCTLHNKLNLGEIEELTN